MVTKINRTDRYLRNQINFYTESTIKIIDSLAVKSANIADVQWYMEIKKEINMKNYIFLEIQSDGFFDYDKNRFIGEIPDNHKHFKSCVEFLKKDKYFVDCYPMDILKNNVYVLIMELPIEGSVEKFLKGDYSKMYTPEQIEVVRPNLNKHGVTAETWENLPVILQETYKESVTGRAVLQGLNTETARNVLKEAHMKIYGFDGIPDNPKEFDMPCYIKDILWYELINPHDDFYEWVDMDQYRHASDIKQEINSLDLI